MDLAPLTCLLLLLLSLSCLKVSLDMAITCDQRMIRVSTFDWNHKFTRVQLPACLRPAAATRRPCTAWASCPRCRGCEGRPRRPSPAGRTRPGKEKELIRVQLNCISSVQLPVGAKIRANKANQHLRCSLRMPYESFPLIHDLTLLTC